MREIRSAGQSIPIRKLGTNSVGRRRPPIPVGRAQSPSTPRTRTQPNKFAAGECRTADFFAVRHKNAATIQWMPRASGNVREVFQRNTSMPRGRASSCHSPHPPRSRAAQRPSALAAHRLKIGKDGKVTLSWACTCPKSVQLEELTGVLEQWCPATLWANKNHRHNSAGPATLHLVELERQCQLLSTNASLPV